MVIEKIFSSLKFNNEDITVILPNNKIEIFTLLVSKMNLKYA
nr:hypothetical protein [uncultured Tyzzerella sp.]